MTHKLDFSEKNSRQLLMNLDIKVESIPLIEQLVAHEIGHVIGMIINDHIIQPFGTPKEISFIQESPSYKYNFTDGVFRVARREVDSDFYGFKGFMIDTYSDCYTTINFIKKDYDTKRFPPYIAYIIMGGLLHLYSDSKIKGYQLEDKHFDDIYSDYNDQDRTSILGAAGDDWTKVRMLCGVYEIDYNFLKTYRKELYNIATQTNFFDCQYSIVNEVHSKGVAIYCDKELNELYSDVTKRIVNSKTFRPFLEEMIFLNQKLLKFM